ncbi:hypothetical protein Tco_0746317 [Tanacetum coccineum]
MLVRLSLHYWVPSMSVSTPAINQCILRSVRGSRMDVGCSMPSFLNGYGVSVTRFLPLSETNSNKLELEDDVESCEKKVPLKLLVCHPLDRRKRVQVYLE